MRLEVLVDQEDPQIFLLNKPKVMVGSSEFCDIVISSDDVSRKHIQILVGEENFFVIDQGSTNGSYINEERLTPGRKVEFTSFFPVRLGTTVLLTLLSDEEEQESSLSEFNETPKKEQMIEFPGTSDVSGTKKAEQTATKALTLGQLKAAKTETLVLHREQKKSARKKGVPKKPVGKKKKKYNINLAQGVSLFILAGSLGYHFYFKDRSKGPEATEKLPVITEVKFPIEKNQLPAEELPKSYLISDSDLASAVEIEGMLSGLKCITEDEKQLCEHILGAQSSPWGVSAVGTKMVVLIDGTVHEENSRALWPINETKIPELTEIQTLMLVNFFKTSVPKESDFSRIKEKVLIVAFFHPIDGVQKLYFAAAIQGDKIKEVMDLIISSPEPINMSDRLAALSFIKRYVRFF